MLSLKFELGEIASVTCFLLSIHLLHAQLVQQPFGVQENLPGGHTHLIESALEFLRTGVFSYGSSVIRSDIGKVIDRENSRLRLFDAAFADFITVDGDGP